ncbi:MAG TPA: RNA polymerase sigma factor [Polyangia bacterium]|jgi:RNA polymerase sigma-70 factor (ECF subfamily)
MLARKKRGRREAAVRDTLKTVRSTVDTVVRRLVGSADPEYEDLVQSSLVNVLATFDGGKFRGDCPPRGWAAVIARNVAVDAIRARARERRVIAHDGDAVADERGRAEGDLGPERLTDLHETLERVNRALRGLGPKKARVVYLHDVLGYQLEEVAAMLGTSVAAAQSRLVRGRREIIETLGPESNPIVRRGRNDIPGEARPRRRKPRSLVLT